ncbi:MAG: proS [Micavibrio sp.]|nr:proS [Micavibrio sp.]
MTNTQAQQKQSAGKNTRTAITPTREENFPEWFQNVIKAADLAENSPVRGCMVIKPYGYAIWELIQRALDDKIKDVDVKNAYFPLLIPLSFISREAEHVDGFAKECAVVTHHRLEKGPDGKLVPAPDSELEEPFVIRPTSETIIGDSMSKWIQSYRDLPLKLNQWCNVMRWEMRPRMFLRTTEFLWQEGHNAFATAEEAHEDAMKMLGVYNQVYEEFFAIGGIQGEKTPDERFPGAINTYTIEAMMQDGKSLQACTSHDLGQNFAKSCDIKFQGEDGQQHHAHTTSWGFSTRSVGGLIMSHSDDDGLILPPKLAPYHVAIIPIVKDDGSAVFEHCRQLAARLKAQGIRVHLDLSDSRSSDKMWSAIKLGIPLRVEIGQREMDEGKLSYVRRDLGKDSKAIVTGDEFCGTVQKVLDQMQADMLAKSTKFTRDHIFDMKSLAEVREFFKADKVGFARIDTSLFGADYDVLKKELSLSSRCLPFEDEGRKVLVGKSY